MDNASALHEIEYWRVSGNWNVKLVIEEMKKHRGLINPGCICYMNSILQQLFFVTEFRNAILGLEFGDSRIMEEIPEEELGESVYVVKALKELFLRLTYSHENKINPIFFANTIKSSENKHLIQLNEQMDID